MCVDVAGEELLCLELLLGDHAVGELEALHLPRLAGQLPEHLHGRLIQHLGEDTRRRGNCGASRKRERLQRVTQK